MLGCWAAERWAAGLLGCRAAGLVLQSAMAKNWQATYCFDTARSVRYCSMGAGGAFERGAECTRRGAAAAGNSTLEVLSSNWSSSLLRRLRLSSSWLHASGTLVL
jgi:hypothetical protein